MYIKPFSPRPGKNLVRFFPPKYGILLSILCLAINSFGQVDANKFKLPAVIENAPTAAALGRYDEIPVSVQTGVPDISIPLYTIRSGGISLPISLSYHASGIKVSDRSSTVGTGWVLNAGGVIARVVQGLADEGTNFASGEGFSKQIFPDENDPMLLDREQCIAAKIVESRNTHKIDAQPDLFIYNITGKSGKFMYKNRLIKGIEPGFMTIPFTPVKIVRQSNKFIVLDTDGTTYIFGDDSGIDFTNSNNYDYTNTTLYNAEYFANVISAWRLTSIISADKSDTITFKYFKNTYINGNNAEASLTQLRNIPNGWYVYSLNNSPGTNNSSVTEALISEIIFKKGKITFDYPAVPTLNKVHIYHEVNGALTELKNFELFHSQFNGLATPNAVRLDSVQETGLLNNVATKNPPTSFTYYKYQGYEIPPYNSKGQDFWGYFNGRTNNPNLLTVANPVYMEGIQTPLPPVSVAERRIPDSNFLKIGTLQTIQYPTGGTTEFDFEANQTAPTQVTHNNIIAIYNYLNAYINESLIDYVPSAQFTVDQDLLLQNVPDNSVQTYNAKLSFEGTRMCTTGSTGCIYNDPTIRLIDLTNNGSLVVATTLGGLDGNTLTSESRDLYVTLTTGHTYRLYFPNPVTLSAGQNYKFMLRSNLQGIRSVTLDTTEITETIRVLTGGLRVRKITSSDNFGKTLIKEYKYPGYYYNSPLFNGDYDALGLHNNFYEKWDVLPPHPSNPGGGMTSCSPVPVMKTYSEGRALPIGSASNNSLSYNEVEEYQSDGSNNYLGKTVYKYKIVQDILTASMPLYKVDKENERGLLLEKVIYKFSNGVFSKVKRTVNDYVNREGQPNIPADSVRSYTAVGVYHFLTIDPEAGRNLPGGGCLSCRDYGKGNVYRLEKFYYTSPRIVLNTAINYDYESEDKYLVDTTFYQYTSALHDFPTKITRTDSRKKSMETYTKYVSDYPYSSCTNSAEQNLRQQLTVLKTSHYNAIIPVLEKYYRSSVSVGINPPPHSPAYLQCDPLHFDSVIYTQNVYEQLKAGFDNVTDAASQLVSDFTAAMNTYNACTLNYYNTASDDQKAIMELQNRNMIAPELETKEFRNGVLASTTQSFYKVFQPNVVAQSRVMHALLNNSPETRIRFLSYDTNGNLLEAAKENDIKTIYFWGYGGLYPVAKITGSDYLTAKQYINQGVLDNPLTTDVQMRAELNKLRINLPGALVSTYTYIPLVGMSSETDNNGKTIFYEYDPLARLKLIRDKDQNILKQFDYKYRTAANGNPN